MSGTSKKKFNKLRFVELKNEGPVKTGANSITV